MALYLPTPAAVALVAGEDANDDLYFDAFTHLYVRRYDSRSTELVGGCATPGGITSRQLSRTRQQALHGKAHAGQGKVGHAAAVVPLGGRTSGSECTHNHRLDVSRVCMFLHEVCTSLSALAGAAADLRSGTVSR